MDDMHDDLAKMKAIIENEKKDLKDNRIYLVMEDTKEDDFFMYCLDKTNNEDGPASICQVLAKGLVSILQNNANDIYSLGEQLLEEEEYEKSNIVSLDSYRRKEYGEKIFRKTDDDDHMTITVTLEDDEGDDG